MKHQNTKPNVRRQPVRRAAENPVRTKLAVALSSKWSMVLVVLLFVVLGVGSLWWAQAATASP